MKKSKEIMAESTRVLRSGAKRTPPSSSVDDGIVAKRTRSESRVLENSSKDNAVPRVLPSTKKVSGIQRTKRLGRPPKSSKAPVPAAETAEKKSRDPSVESRSALKHRISDQIKSTLLKAGWTIDLRPRNGRNYMDAVYLPPAPYKGSFWSVTKAYSVYLQHTSSSTELASDQVPEDLLSMLSRQTDPDGGRRRRRIEADNTRKKCRRKLKDAAAKKLNGCVGNKKRRGLLVRKANEDADDYVAYPWKRTVLSWIIDSGVVSADAKVNYVNEKKKRVMEGWITREGIRCGCCSYVVTPLEFEAHAGSKLRRPSENIIVEEGGISLLQCQVDAWEKQEESERKGFWDVDVGEDDPSDDTCPICGDGGDLVCCDGCPSTYHLNCLGLETLPPDDWHCWNCSCKFCGLIDNGASDEDDTAVSLLLSCSQCEQKFHQDCIPSTYSVSTGSGFLFCGHSCEMIFMQLQNLLGVKNDLEGGFSWTLIRRFDDESVPLCSLPQKAECNSKIAVALAVMNECFLSTVDKRSGIKLIHNVVYNCGANISRLDYSGFYTFTLERGDEIISVASVRIHGTRVAEMPYIGTRNMYRRQGMCHRLLNGIESALCSLNIEKLIIPAISELTEIWTGIFGFKPLELSHKQEARSTNLLVFPGIDLLQKPMLTVDSAAKHTIVDGADQVELEIDQHCELDAANEFPGLSSLGSISDEVACSS